MPEIYLRQLGFTYSACRKSTENQTKNKKI